MATKDEANVVKDLAWPFIIGTIAVVAIALVGRAMTAKKS